MFNEELDLEPVEEKDEVGGSRKTDGHAHQVKQEVNDGIKTEARDSPASTQHLTTQPGLPTTSRPPGPPGPPGTKAAGSSGLLSKVGPSIYIGLYIGTNQ